MPALCFHDFKPSSLNSAESWHEGLFNRNAEQTMLICGIVSKYSTPVRQPTFSSTFFGISKLSQRAVETERRESWNDWRENNTVSSISVLSWLDCSKKKSGFYNWGRYDWAFDCEKPGITFHKSVNTRSFLGIVCLFLDVPYAADTDPLCSFPQTCPLSTPSAEQRNALMCTNIVTVKRGPTNWVQNWPGGHF